MMYLTDLPSLSSLNLETHSGETETLFKAVVSAKRVRLEVWLRFFVYCVWHGKEGGGKLGDGYPDLLCGTVSTCYYVAGRGNIKTANLP